MVADFLRILDEYVGRSGTPRRESRRSAWRGASLGSLPDSPLRSLFLTYTRRGRRALRLRSQESDRAPASQTRAPSSRSSPPGSGGVSLRRLQRPSARADSAYRMTVDADSTTWRSRLIGRARTNTGSCSRTRSATSRGPSSIPRHAHRRRQPRAYSASRRRVVLPKPAAPFDGTVDPNALSSRTFRAGLQRCGRLPGSDRRHRGRCAALCGLFGVNTIGSCRSRRRRRASVGATTPITFSPSISTTARRGLDRLRGCRARERHGGDIGSRVQTSSTARRFKPSTRPAPTAPTSTTRQTTGSAWGMRGPQWHIAHLPPVPPRRRAFFDRAIRLRRLSHGHRGARGLRRLQVVAGPDQGAPSEVPPHRGGLLLRSQRRHHQGRLRRPVGRPAHRSLGRARQQLPEHRHGPAQGRALRRRTWVTGRGSFDTVSNPMWGLENVMTPVPYLPAPYMSVRYIVSHDERHVVDEVERNGSDDAKILGGIRKAKLGALALFTATGMPMFYMGEEIGDNSSSPTFPRPTSSTGARGTRRCARCTAT